MPLSASEAKRIAALVAAEREAVNEYDSALRVQQQTHYANPQPSTVWQVYLAARAKTDAYITDLRAKRS